MVLEVQGIRKSFHGVQDVSLLTRMCKGDFMAYFLQRETSGSINIVSLFPG